MKILKNILLASILLLMVSACDKPQKQYKLSAQEAMDIYLAKEDILSVEKLANILLCKHEHHYQMIDLRTPPEFIRGHIDGAISIPAKNVLDMEYFEILNQDDKINVLYCRGKNQAINIYMILKQLGFKNIKVALGGYDFINDFIVLKYGINSGDYNDEKPKYNYMRLVADIDKPKNDSIAAPEVIYKNPNKVIKDFDEECPDLN